MQTPMNCRYFLDKFYSSELILNSHRTDVFEKIEHVTYPDEGDRFEREPEIGVFKLKGCGK